MFVVNTHPKQSTNGNYLLDVKNSVTLASCKPNFISGAGQLGTAV